MPATFPTAIALVACLLDSSFTAASQPTLDFGFTSISLRFHFDLTSTSLPSAMADPFRSSGAPSFVSPYLQAFKAAAYRLDEGYSEDTRSQADSRMGEGDIMEHETGQPLLLPDWVVNMSESDRSGESCPCNLFSTRRNGAAGETSSLVLACTMLIMRRFCLLDPSLSTDFLYRGHCRPSEPAPPHRPHFAPPSRNHV